MIDAAGVQLQAMIFLGINCGFGNADCGTLPLSAVDLDPLTDARILVTGVTGQVGGPLARRLAAAGNTVFGASRFSDPAARDAFEADGVRPVSIDLEAARLDEVPDGLDYVIHMAVSKHRRFERAHQDGAGRNHTGLRL